MQKSSIITFGFLVAILSAVPRAGYAQANAAEAREEQIYKNGTAAMNSQQWQSAIDQFSQIKGTRADGATYWKAYAQNKLGQRTAALETIGLLTKQFPRSTWINDAKALEIEIRGPSGQSPPAATDVDDDLKLYAINGLLSTDPERAVPILEQVLSGSQSMKLKERALFVLSQNSSTRAQELMANIARGQVQPSLQTRAIQNLGISGQKKLLSDIYASGSVEAKRAALKAMGISGAKDELLAAAKSERDPQLRKEALNGLAISGGREQLRQLYKEATDSQAKRDLLRTAVITGDQDLVTNALQSDSDIEVRREALRTLGITGGSNVVSLLVNSYNTEKDPSMRNAAVDALFIRGAVHELVELAKKEQDPQMKKRLVQKLALMQDKEATDYMIQLLEK